MRESQISREIVDFLRGQGFAVWDTGQGFRKDTGGTRITPGLCDLIVMGTEVNPFLLFVEVKTAKGRLRDSQAVFRDECATNGVAWELWRDVRDAFDWLVAKGIIEV